MSQINRPPIGLQGLLGSKNFGVNPSDLNQQVVPIVDLFDFWASQTLRYIKETAVTAGVGNVINTVVPSDKVWMPLSVAFLADVDNTGHDTNYQIRLDENTLGNVSFTVASEKLENPQVTYTHFPTIWQPVVPFFLPAGYAIRGWIDSNSAIARDYELDVVVYEIDA